MAVFSFLLNVKIMYQTSFNPFIYVHTHTHTHIHVNYDLETW